MSFTHYQALDEDSLFEVQGRKEMAPARKTVALRGKRNFSSKQKLAERSRFRHCRSR